MNIFNTDILARATRLTIIAKPTYINIFANIDGDKETVGTTLLNQADAIQEIKDHHINNGVKVFEYLYTIKDASGYLTKVNLGDEK
jgi:hypothetical protein